jgi:putative oxidoreductase
MKQLPLVDPADLVGRVSTALLALRLGVFLVMLMWTLDKFVAPDHARRIFENFYGIGGLDVTASYIVGAVELVLILAFVAGLRKRLTYGLVFLLHTVSTLSSYRQYLDPFDNLLFFAAWPMLAACFTLYSLRDLDTRWTLGSRPAGQQA